MTNMKKADKVLEVGCGPGAHSVMLAQNFLKVNGILVSCDYSKKMIANLEDNYLESDYMLV